MTSAPEPATPGIEAILAPRPRAQPRIYAYTVAADTHAGLLKIGQTTRRVKDRVDEQLKTAAIPYTIVLDEIAALPDGGILTDHAVRAALRRKGFANPQGEWMRCGVADVKNSDLAVGASPPQFGGTCGSG